MKKALAAAALCLTWSGAAAAADYTIKLAHFWPATSSIHKDIFEAWAEAVQTQSQGRIKVEVYPSQTLVKAQSSYDAVKSRIADATATTQGYTANKFPLSQVVELPGLIKTSTEGSCVLQTLYDEKLIAGEYKDTHVLFLFTSGPGHIHTVGKAVAKPGDLAGLRIRRPTPVVGELLEGLGAQPVGMPAPQAYESMQKGVIDGATFPWEGSLVFRLHEQAKYHTEIGLFGLAFVATMNKDLYAQMPADLKAVLDANSGRKWGAIAGKVFDDLDRKGAEAAAGHEVVKIENGIENPDWKPILAKASDKYLADLEGKGLPAKTVYARAAELARSTCN